MEARLLSNQQGLEQALGKLVVDAKRVELP